VNVRERVSRAICKAHGFDPDDKDALYILREEPDGRPLWEAYLDVADSAIRAVHKSL